MKLSRTVNLVVFSIVACAVSFESQGRSYDEELAEVRDGSPESNYQALRYAWTHTSTFDPYYRDSEDFVGFMDSFDVPDDELERVSTNCHNIPSRFFVDARLHIICVNLLEGLGDSARAAFHGRVYSGLIDSIEASGTGESSATAYVVVSAYEEVDFLTNRGLRIEEHAKPKTELPASIITVTDEFGAQRSLWFVKHERFDQYQRWMLRRAIDGVGDDNQ